MQQVQAVLHNHASVIVVLERPADDLEAAIERAVEDDRHLDLHRGLGELNHEQQRFLRDHRLVA